MAIGNIHSENYVAIVKEPCLKFCGLVQIAALTTLGILEVPEHATEMTHSSVKTTLKFLHAVL